MNSLDHVDLNLLRVFQAIVEERSLTRAGQRLALSQPAISYSLG
ncbi:MAG TPA: LysR family transcriptional regulator, partial [Paraburkholderia sp.]